MANEKLCNYLIGNDLDVFDYLLKKYGKEKAFKLSKEYDKLSETLDSYEDLPKVFKEALEELFPKEDRELEDWHNWNR